MYAKLQIALVIAILIVAYFIYQKAVDLSKVMEEQRQEYQLRNL